LCKTPNRVMEEELQNETKTETDTGTLKGNNRIRLTEISSADSFLYGSADEILSYT
jgi:hypothetical protein